MAFLYSLGEREVIDLIIYFAFWLRNYININVIIIY